MAHDVFISHASADKAVADAVCASLENAGLRCWIAPRDVQPGRSYAGELTRAIQQSRAMVLIFSAQTNRSDQVLRELQLAVEAHLHIVQFRIEDVVPNDDLKYFLSTPHWLDALTPPLERHLERLTAALRTLVVGVPPVLPATVESTPKQNLPPVRKKTPWRKAAVLAAGVILFCGFVTAAVGTRQIVSWWNTVADTYASEGTDSWRTGADYQKRFEAQVAKPCYPIWVEGRWHKGREEFRAAWRPGRSPYAAIAHHGLTQEAFATLKTRYADQGYKLVYKSEFTNGPGVTKYQALWMKDCGIVGMWDWSRTEVVTALDDGTVTSQYNGEGTWEQTGPQTYILRWKNGFIDMMGLSEDGNSLTGSNQYGGQPNTFTRRG